LPEILILGNDDASLRRRKMNYLLVACSAHDFRNSHYVVPGGFQAAHDGKVAALVGQEAHFRR
jgi:hypothetical protein